MLYCRFEQSIQEDSVAHSKGNTEFVVKAVPSAGGPSEFRQFMTPHPLVHQELPYDPQFGIYNRRLRSLHYSKVATKELYWRLRRHVGLAHTGELATEIRGPDAEAMLNRVFTRDVTRVRVGRCSYQLACFADGGMIMDGVLLRLAPDRFWYAQGDGEFPVWLRAHSEGFDVEVFDANADVIGERILEAGEPYRIHTLPAAATNARRIEAGLLFSGTDFDDSVTPFAAGLGAFVDLSKADFVGMAALAQADKSRRTWGLQCRDGVASRGDTLFLDGESIGRVCSSAWSPYLQCGVAIVRLKHAEIVPGTELRVECTDGLTRSGEVSELPMYDRDGEIPRGKRTDIPDIA